MYTIEITYYKGGSKMEVVRKYVDASSLMSIMALPETFQNQKLEVIIFPTGEYSKKDLKNSEIKNVICSLVGALPSENMSLEEYREERLKKYEVVD